MNWSDIHLNPEHGSRFGYLCVREGKSRNARRIVSLSVRVRAMLASRKLMARSSYVFSNG